MAKKKGKWNSAAWTALIITGVIFGYVMANDAYLSQHIDYPKNNLLANGSFELNDQEGKPLNWNIKADGPKISIDKRPGYHGESSLHVDLTDYQVGNISIESEKVTVNPNQNYFFKIYTKTTIDCDLLIHFSFKDGSERYELAERYPAVDEVWSTMSTPIRANAEVTSISLAIQSFGNGYIDLDNAYLITTDNLGDPSNEWGEQNSIPNSDLEKQDSDHKPSDWLTYRAGDNKAEYNYSNEGANHYHRVVVSDHRSGEAKWQYLPLPVAGNQRQQFGVDYRSNTPVDVIVEYELANGTRRFSQIAELNPTSVWTRVTKSFETIPQARKMFVALVLHRDGYVESDNYVLVTQKDIKAQTFKQPIITMTFDDGWLSQFTKAHPLLKQNNFPATFYINSATIGTNGFITLGQVRELKNDGHQIASHGHQHLDITAMSVKAFQDQLTSTKKYLERKLNEKTIDYASPFGKHNRQTETFVRSIYSSHRGTDTGINTKSSFDRYNMKVLFIRDDSDIRSIGQVIEETKATNGWLILVYHQFDVDNNRNAIESQKLQRHLELIKKSEIPVVTIRQALEEIEKES